MRRPPELAQVAALGLIQGVAELLPVSSSAHVAAVPRLLGWEIAEWDAARRKELEVALHAGELALGDVPPEELQYHIDQAVNLAGADRIGHGIDLAHETNVVAIMQRMREKDIPVEINLTSNSFISGVAGANHPINLYRKYGVPFVISTDDAGVDVIPIGRTAGKRIIFELPHGDFVVTLDALREAHEGFFPRLMGADAALA